jgi:hypothetical protein
MNTKGRTKHFTPMNWKVPLACRCWCMRRTYLKIACRASSNPVIGNHGILINQIKIIITIEQFCFVVVVVVVVFVKGKN